MKSCQDDICFDTLFVEYYLEDVVQMLGFVPMSNTRKNKNSKNNVEEEDDTIDKEDDVRT